MLNPVLSGSLQHISDEWVALVSGLEVGAADAADGQLQLLAEYLAGEAGSVGEQTQSSCISRLIIAGNSFAPVSGSSAISMAELDRKSVRPSVLQSCYGSVTHATTSSAQIWPGGVLHATSHPGTFGALVGLLSFAPCASPPRTIRPRRDHTPPTTSASRYVRRFFPLRKF